MTLTLCTASGEQHGLINTIGNSVAFDDFKHMDPKTKAKCEKEKKEDGRMVKARYLNKRGAHERLEKPYCRWSGEPIRLYKLLHNYVYDLPYGFVREVNEKKGKRRAGLVSLDGVSVNRDESPLERDVDDDQIHMLVPVDF